MRLGLNLGYWGSTPVDNVALAQEADRLGYHSVWTAEAYGSDAVTPLTWVAAQTKRINVGTAIMQIPARTPANTAMTAATLDLLTGGRFLLGLGMSGPQVVEGWHGEHYGKPLGRTREYVEIVRAALKREKPLEHHGEHYDVPVKGGTGLGKPLRMILHPLRAELPIYLAAIGPKNVALAAEIADGWLPAFFAPEHISVFRPSLEEGFRAAGNGKGYAQFDIAVGVRVVVGNDLDACRNQVRPGIALYVGGMGARGKNFYNDLAMRYGFEAEAKKIQDLYLSGHKEESAAAVTDAMVDAMALCGTPERIKDRLQLWTRCGATTLILSTHSIDTLRMLAEFV
ncbi:MAG: LLM class F420-dependent oxidoreductase [Chloroflexi bacterium]|nr:LLM class F420-dependent oxidoreductase [Chloroflexota bacterium]